LSVSGASIKTLNLLDKTIAIYNNYQNSLNKKGYPDDEEAENTVEQLTKDIENRDYQPYYPTDYCKCDTDPLPKTKISLKKKTKKSKTKKGSGYKKIKTKQPVKTASIPGELPRRISW
jgi:hypothetical protein